MISASATERAAERARAFPRVGDHLALDLLNTVVLRDGDRVDLLDSDQSVRSWLDRFGVDRSRAPQRMWNSGDLLRSARKLREAMRSAVNARKAGQPVNLAPLNTFLRRGASHSCMQQNAQGTLSLERQWDQQTPEALLAPVAEAAARLLIEADFDLVRKCESESCILWFLDKTKSHHRRWCSAASCGNRAKVAAYRNRQRASEST